MVAYKRFGDGSRKTTRDRASNKEKEILALPSQAETIWTIDRQYLCF